MAEVDEEQRDIIKECGKFLKRSSERWAADIEEQEDALQVSNGHFWNLERKKRWSILDDHDHDLIPTVSYNCVDTQCNAIASPFSKSPFHINVVDKNEVQATESTQTTEAEAKSLQDKISDIEADNQAKSQYQQAFTRGVTCGAGYIVIGTKEDNGMIVPSIEFVSNQRMVAFDPDCITPSGEDAEEGALISYISVKKAKRLYGDDVVPPGYENGGSACTQTALDFSGCKAWPTKTGKVQVVKYFTKEDVTDELGQKSTKVKMYEICGNKIVSEPIVFDTDIIPIIRFAGYHNYDEEYGQVYTGYVQKMMEQIQELSLAKTIQALRMRRCSNVRIIGDVRAIEGCEQYVQDFEKSASLFLGYNGAKGNPPQIVQDTFNTGDVQSVISEGRQAMADMTGINPAGIDTRERTAYEVMQQQTNSESNVQALYINAELACHTIGKVIIGISNKGIVPKFTLEGGPAVITTKMKERQEIQAISDMVDPTHKELCAIKMAETIDSPIAKQLAEDLKANCQLQLTAGQSLGSVINAAEMMKTQLEQATTQLKEIGQQNIDLAKQVEQLEAQLQDAKEARALDWAKFEAQMNMDQANLAVQNAQEAKKLEQADAKLELQAYSEINKANQAKESQKTKKSFDTAKMLADLKQQQFDNESANARLYLDSVKA